MKQDQDQNDYDISKPMAQRSFRPPQRVPGRAPGFIASHPIRVPRELRWRKNRGTNVVSDLVKQIEDLSHGSWKKDVAFGTQQSETVRPTINERAKNNKNRLAPF